MRQLVVPRRFRYLVPSLTHRPGHLGREKTTQRVTDEYLWPGVYTEVKKLCKACKESQMDTLQLALPCPVENHACH